MIIMVYHVETEDIFLKNCQSMVTLIQQPVNAFFSYMYVKNKICDWAICIKFGLSFEL